jgi:hypothetical protein
LFVTKVERFKEAAFVAETITTYKSRMRRHGIHAQLQQKIQQNHFMGSSQGCGFLSSKIPATGL